MQKNGKDPAAARSRTGYGAASVIPHLNDVIPLEPSQLRDAPMEPAQRAGPGDGEAREETDATTD